MKANKEIIEGLEKIKRGYELEKNRGKVMGYRRAIDALKAVKTPITSADQLVGLSGVGDGIRRKVKEYFDKGTFREAINPFSDDKMKEINELSEIWGVGPTKAIDLHQKGFKTIAKLREQEAKGKSPLTSLQSKGLKYFEDLKEKMPREEAAELTEQVV